MPETDVSLNTTINLGLNFVTRRRWCILLTGCGVALSAIAIAYWLPDRYSSEATLVAVQQQVSQRYVEPGNNTTPAAALQAMTREVLSVSKLTGVIEEFGLYAKERQRMTPEALAEGMRRQVVIDTLDDVGRNDFRAFKITFTAATPQLAQAVTSRLTSLFINENIKSRENQATRTTNFLTERVETARKKLLEQEERLQAFKRRNLGELPEQQQANFGKLNDLRMQLQNITASLSRAQQQRSFLESSINGNVIRLQSERSNLLKNYTPRHAEVIRKDQEIARMKAFLERLKPGASGVDSPENIAASNDPSVALWKGQVEANTSEMLNLSRDEQRLRAEIATYENRVSLTPVREQQLAEIMRDYDSYKEDYTGLLNKQLQSQVSSSLEERQEGQQFRLVDPPTLPSAPSSPQRIKISLGGAGAGLLLGFALAFLLDTRNSTFHFDEELRQCFTLPLVMGVPLLPTPAEERKRHWKTAFEWLAASVLMVVWFAAEFYVYRNG